MPSPINNDFSLAHPRTQEYLDWLQPPAFDLQELWGPGIAQRAQEFSATVATVVVASAYHEVGPGLCRRPKLPREPVEALPLPG